MTNVDKFFVWCLVFGLLYAGYEIRYVREDVRHVVCRPV